MLRKLRKPPRPGLKSGLILIIVCHAAIMSTLHPAACPTRPVTQLMGRPVSIFLPNCHRIAYLRAFQHRKSSGCPADCFPRTASLQPDATAAFYVVLADACRPPSRLCSSANRAPWQGRLQWSRARRPRALR